MHKLREIKAHDWHHLKELMTNDFSHQYGHVFRGQRDSTWKLESTLTRLMRDANAPATHQSIESRLIKLFRLAIRGLRGPNPLPLSDTDIFCLGQHYGLATPLLDWTESPYIAAYFAFESSTPSSNGERAIWMLNRMALEKKIKSSDKLSFLEPLQDDNSRIVAQCGLFTRTPTGLALEDALANLGHLDCLTKLVIEDDERLNALNELNLMNIGAKSLFPDLHGAAKYCNMWFEIAHENFHKEIKIVEIVKQFGFEKSDFSGKSQ